MKTRTSLVSNSSSASFVVLGVSLPKRTSAEKLEEYDDKLREGATKVRVYWNEETNIIPIIGRLVSKSSVEDLGADETTFEELTKMGAEVKDALAELGLDDSEISLFVYTDID